MVSHCPFSNLLTLNDCLATRNYWDIRDARFALHILEFVRVPAVSCPEEFSQSNLVFCEHMDDEVVAIRKYLMAMPLLMHRDSYKCGVTELRIERRRESSHNNMLRETV